MKICKLVPDENGKESLFIDDIKLDKDPIHSYWRATKDQLAGLDVRNVPVRQEIIVYEMVEKDVWYPCDITFLICKRRVDENLSIVFYIVGDEKPWPTEKSSRDEHDLIVYQAKKMAVQYWENQGLLEISEYNNDNGYFWFPFLAMKRCETMDEAIQLAENIILKIKKTYYQLIAHAWKEMHAAFRRLNMIVDEDQDLHEDGDEK
jgi:hypothetical protein